MDTSTPQWRARESRDEIYDEVSPIQQICDKIEKESSCVENNPNLSNGSNSTGNMSTLMETGLSPQIRKLLIMPRNENEFMEMRKLVRETINLTRAAMDRGLIPDDGISRYDDLFENSMYKCFPSADRFSLSLMLVGLNLDDWEREDIYADFGIERPNNDRSSILSQDDEIDHMSWDDLNRSEDQNHGRRMITQDLAAVGKIIKLNDSSPTELQDRDHNGKLITQELVALGKIINKYPQKDVITQELGAVGKIINEERIGTKQEDSPAPPALPTPKRKQLSPYGETQVARALKLGKGNDSSPILRDNGKERNITIKRHNGPLSGFSTPQQTKRKPVKKIRRCLNPDNRQLLINSMFSPRADLSARNDTISADTNGDASNLE